MSTKTCSPSPPPPPRPKKVRDDGFNISKTKDKFINNHPPCVKAKEKKIETVI